MKEKELNLTLKNDPSEEIIIRHGYALPAKEPVPVKITGNIDAPLRWLHTREKVMDNIESHVLIDRQNYRITLFERPRDAYGNEITGQIVVNPDLAAFRVNGEGWTTRDLSNFIKMNTHHFDSREVATSLVAILKNLKAKIEKEIDREDDSRGNQTMKFEQKVDSQIPPEFDLTIALFKGQDKTKFTVTIELEANGNDITCFLVSPTMKEAAEKMRDDLMDEQHHDISQIKDLVIIEV